MGPKRTMTDGVFMVMILTRALIFVHRFVHCHHGEQLLVKPQLVIARVCATLIFFSNCGSLKSVYIFKKENQYVAETR